MPLPTDHETHPHCRIFSFSPNEHGIVIWESSIVSGCYLLKNGDLVDPGVDTAILEDNQYKSAREAIGKLKEYFHVKRMPIEHNDVRLVYGNYPFFYALKRK